MDVKIIIKTGKNEYHLTVDEAQEIYKELEKMFGDKERVYIPYSPITYPTYPDTYPGLPPYSPMPVWYTTSLGEMATKDGRVSIPDVKMEGGNTANEK